MSETKPEQKSELPKIVKSGIILNYKICRNAAVIDTDIKTDEETGFLKLPYNPKDGDEKNLAPDETCILETGISFEIPKGYLLTVYQTVSLGRPGQLIPVLTLSSKNKEELQVPLTNYASKRAYFVKPGDYPFYASLSKAVEVLTNNTNNEKEEK